MQIQTVISKPANPSQVCMYATFEEQLSRRHPLYILANQVNWQLFEDQFSPLFSATTGRPAKPIRRMVALLMLKHIRNLSDESVVEQWGENSYYQYLSGEKSFATGKPCDASELVHFRHRIGQQGIELIFQESIRINGKDADDSHVSIDTTVQEKNITYPTDAKLHKKIITKCQQMAADEGLAVRQSYRYVLKKLSLDQRFRGHPKNKAKARKADKKLKTIAGRLVRELARQLAGDHHYQTDIALFERVLSQQRSDSHKIYSLHEPQVQCISKGKEHKKYEFGNKVSLVYTQTTGVIVGALGFCNEYDGHTLERALAQTSRLRGHSPLTATADRGYRGISRVGQTQIIIPKPASKSASVSQRAKKKKRFARRAAIEAVIGHLKADNRLSRNFYKGIVGDNINVMLSAAGFNFRRMLNKWKSSILWLLQNLYSILHPAYSRHFLYPITLKKSF